MQVTMELTDSEKGPEQKSGTHSQHSTADFAEGELVLVSEGPALARTFNLLSACATGITTGNSWAVLGAGIVHNIPIGTFLAGSNSESRLRRFTTVERLGQYMSSA